MIRLAVTDLNCGLPLGRISTHLLNEQEKNTTSALIKSLDPAYIVYSASTLTVYQAEWCFLCVKETKGSAG